ncbi:MAG: GAF domain-containing protein, partial [Alphaproteobacteria bacterium]|nr:GAF domain-containing protein [Alphaproteobacteria bacterium]
MVAGDGGNSVIDPAEARRQSRHRWSRIGLPIIGVGLIIAAILGIAWYSYETNKRDALQLADEVIQSQAQRISREVDAYLGPAPRAVELLRGVLSDGKFLGEPQGGAEAIGWQILFDNPQLSLISYASPDGSFMMAKREASGAIDTKVIDRRKGAPETTWTRRDPQGATRLVEKDPTDTYDPRTRVWYQGAVEARGKVHWSRLYIFFTDQKPGLTASGALFDTKGALTAVFGVDIALDTLSRFLAALQIGKSGRAMIVDGDGRLVAYPDAARTFKRVGDQLLPASLDELGDGVLTRAYNRFRIEGHGRRTIEIDGERYITAATPVLADADHDWSTLIVVPEKDFVGFVALNNRSTLLMSFGVVLLSALFAALLIHQGLRADRNAALVVLREQSREAQSRAFTELAANAALFDPTQEDAVQALTKIAARAVGAKRFGLWRVSSDSNAMVLEDCRDRENDGHTAGVELTRTEMPGFFAAAEAGQELEVAEAAKDARTADFHKLYLKRMGSRSVITVPIRSGERWLGLVVVEDWRADGALSFARAVANMLAVRFAARARTTVVAAPAAAVVQVAA